MIDPRKKPAFAKCMLALALSSQACQSHSAEEEPAAGPIPVTCAPARSAAVAERIELRGAIHPPPEREVVVSPIVAGRLLEIRVHEGDRVTKGQVLATVDDPALAADSTEAEAIKAGAQAAFETAQVALTRAQRLFDQGIAARREVDEARAAVSSADAALKGANARAELASTRRARAAVTTPIAGVVLKLQRAPGDLVDGTSQTPLAQVADPSVLELRADAPAPALVRLREGAAVELYFDALPEQTLRGHVAVVAAAVDSQTGLGTVRIAIDPSELALKIGLAGRAAVQLGAAAPATIVPASALRRSRTGEDEVVVCAHDKDGKTVAEVRTVKLGPQQANDVQVREGVKAGELVVIDHALGLEPDAELNPEAEHGATQ